MTPTCTAEDRAKQLEREIMKLVDAGKITLTHGVYGEGTEDSCVACALGSAARAICGVEETLSINYGGRQCVYSSEGLRRKLVERGVATYEETIRMEAGFEGFNKGWVSQFGSGLGSIKWDTKDPFYKLGRRLSSRARRGS